MNIADTLSLDNLSTAQIKDILKSHNISRGAIKLFETLYITSYNQGFVTEKSHAYIAKMVDYEERYLKKLFRELEENGFIDVTEVSDYTGSKPNRFVLKLPNHKVDLCQTRKDIPPTEKKTSPPYPVDNFSPPPPVLRSEEKSPLGKSRPVEGGDVKKTPLLGIYNINNNNNTNNTYNDLDLTRAREEINYYDKLTKFSLSVPLVSNPKEFRDELKFYFKQLLSQGKSLERAFEIVTKLVNEDRWRTPYGLRYGEEEKEVIEDPDQTLPISSEMSELFKGILKPPVEP